MNIFKIAAALFVTRITRTVSLPGPDVGGEESHRVNARLLAAPSVTNDIPDSVPSNLPWVDVSIVDKDGTLVDQVDLHMVPMTKAICRTIGLALELGDEHEERNTWGDDTIDWINAVTKIVN